MEERKDLVGSNTELSLGHVFEISDLNDGVDAAGTEVQQPDAAFHDGDAPPEET